MSRGARRRFSQCLFSFRCLFCAIAPEHRAASPATARPSSREERGKRRRGEREDKGREEREEEGREEREEEKKGKRREEKKGKRREEKKGKKREEKKAYREEGRAVAGPAARCSGAIAQNKQRKAKRH